MVRIGRHASLNQTADQKRHRQGAPLSTPLPLLFFVPYNRALLSSSGPHKLPLEEDLSRRATEFLSRMAKGKKKAA